MYRSYASSGSVLSNTTIFPKKEGRKREISVRGSSLREANVQVSAKGALHDGQDTVKTLRMIIWYKRACIRQTTRQLSVAVQPLKKDVKKNVVIEQVPNQKTLLEINHVVTNMTTIFNETTASDRVSRQIGYVAHRSHSICASFLEVEARYPISGYSHIKNCGHVRDMVDFQNRVCSLESVL